ncbi:hypothetical protein HDV00_007184 [Rhizophlyctis rosea]|nr:hypothetical protein HDV00_007184 [Rhizophlyctis rosea]
MQAKLFLLAGFASTALAATTCRPITVTSTAVRTTTKTTTTTKSITSTVVKTSTTKVTSTTTKTLPAVTITSTVRSGGASVSTVTHVSTVNAPPVTITQTVTAAPGFTTTTTTTTAAVPTTTTTTTTTISTTTPSTTIAAPPSSTTTIPTATTTTAQDNSCTDVAVVGDPYGCAQQAAWGNCSQSWMTASGNCLASCNACPGSSTPTTTTAPTSPSTPSCTDVAVSGDPYGCAQQAAWGNCSQSWMTASGNCLASCNACPGSSTSPMVSVYTKCTVPNTLALAFDDGTYLYQQQIIDAFNDAGYKTTFFTTGKLYQCIFNEGAVSSLRSAYATGHQIASHTWSHPDMTKLTQDGQTTELTKLDDALSKILGVKPTYLRPPYLAINNDLKQVAYKVGFTHIITDDIDSQDWNGATVDASFNTITQAVNASNTGHIVLAHEVYNGTALQLVPRIIEWAKQTGVQLVPVATCLGEEDQGLWYRDVTTQGERGSTWVC